MIAGLQPGQMFRRRTFAGKSEVPRVLPGEKRFAGRMGVNPPSDGWVFGGLKFSWAAEVGALNSGRAIP